MNQISMFEKKERIKKILLIDADSTIPNLALMKLSSYYKSLKYQVDLIKLNISYYPNKKNKINYINNTFYHKTYCSVIFENSINFIKGENIIYGGTGYNLTTNLPEYVENLNPDYSIYLDNDISYGFITRGCIRNCWFCKVPQKEGSIKKVNTITQIVKHKKVKFLDNNILAYDDHKLILKEIIEKKLKCCFNQGLDIRLLDSENSFLLSQIKYLGEYTFAFDDIKLKELIETKMKLLSWRKPWQIRFFIYVHPKMELSDTIKRIEWCKTNKCLPYIMRDLTCWSHENSNFYTDISSWCNQPNIFKKMEFEEFLKKRTTNTKRINTNINIYRRI